jgi:phosphatidylglycerophosphatase A
MVSLTAIVGRGSVLGVNVQNLTQKCVEILATGFYVGKLPAMPGTFGTLWGIPVVWLLAQGSPIFYMVAVIAFLLAAAAIAQLYESFTTAHDPGEVVIDEVVGYSIAMTWLPLTWQSFVLSFLLFRIFDIWKPYPINVIDRKVSGGLGTVLDDVAAGLASNIILQVIFAQTTLLGVRYGF